MKAQVLPEAQKVLPHPTPFPLCSHLFSFLLAHCASAIQNFLHTFPPACQAQTCPRAFARAVLSTWNALALDVCLAPLYLPQDCSNPTFPIGLSSFPSLTLFSPQSSTSCLESRYLIYLFPKCPVSVFLHQGRGSLLCPPIF